jgi:primosomal protein N' (replication factor Y)
VLEAVLPRAVKEQSGTRWVILLSAITRADAHPESLSPKQRQAYELLLEAGKPLPMEEATRLARVGPGVIKGLIQKGWASASRQRLQRWVEGPTNVTRTKSLVLNKHQQEACDRIVRAIETGASTHFLLHGVTGSGKTEVYLQSIAEVVKRGREAIVLVPEISLTPQTIERFRGRFNEIAVLHSHLSDSERHGYWQRIQKGEVHVVVGARSAIFAPCRNLGLVIIDEEHETTFKQETTPRYHARTVAFERSRLESVPVVLGSATPSLESWMAAHRGECELLSLPERVGELTMPRVRCIDLREEYRRQRGLASISPSLAKAMLECLERKGQVILLLNRRGFAPAIICPQCGQTAKCHHCDIALTFHKHRGQAVCHSCDATCPAPRQCSHCGHNELKLTGFGTQRLQDEVKARFPNARCERMDSDTMRTAGHYERVLTAFRNEEVDILLGTQMIAKGLDFPNVQLVGVISADTARNIPDFRASEKTFQLIVQVAGRAGRGRDPGLVLVQTFNPEDPAILNAIRTDYLRFVAGELPTRRDFNYPPYGKLTRIIVRSKSEQESREAARTIAHSLTTAAKTMKDVQILGPAPAPVTKLRDFYRYHLQIHTPDSPSRQSLLEKAFGDLTISSMAEYVVDVDPVDLL